MTTDTTGGGTAPARKKKTRTKAEPVPSLAPSVAPVAVPTNVDVPIEPRSASMAWVPWLLFFVVLFLLIDHKVFRKQTHPPIPTPDVTVVVDNPVHAAVVGIDREVVLEYAAFYEAVADIVALTKKPISTPARDAALAMMPVRIPALSPVIEERLAPFKDLPQVGGWKDDELADYVAVWRDLSLDLLNAPE